MRSRTFRLWRFGTLSFYTEDRHWSMSLFITGINILLSWSITKASDEPAEDSNDAYQPYVSSGHHLFDGHAIINGQPHKIKWYGTPPDDVTWFSIRPVSDLPVLERQGPIFVVDDNDAI